MENKKVVCCNIRFLLIFPYLKYNIKQIICYQNYYIYMISNNSKLMYKISLKSRIKVNICSTCKLNTWK